jgi:hypothetical protein
MQVYAYGGEDPGDMIEAGLLFNQHVSGSCSSTSAHSIEVGHLLPRRKQRRLRDEPVECQEGFAVVVTKRRKHVPDDVLWGSILIFGLMLICFALACALTSLDNEESAD